jgi:hypothetical protein
MHVHVVIQQVSGARCTFLVARVRYLDAWHDHAAEVRFLIPSNTLASSDPTGGKPGLASNLPKYSLLIILKSFPRPFLNFIDNSL